EAIMGRLKLAKDHLYTRGAARASDLVYLALRDRKLDRRSIQHSRLVGLYQGNVGSLKDATYTTVGMCVVQKPAAKLVAVSDQGEVFTYVGGKATQEKIAPRPSDLRGCRTIGGYAYACGMHREVFVRRAEASWKALPARRGDGRTVAGFEA